MFSEAAPPESVDEFGASMLAFHPAGFKDVRAPLTVAEDLHAAISGSTLVVLRNTGHLCKIEAPDEFNRAVRTFLLDRRS